jgi:hypothetical protein
MSAVRTIHVAADVDVAIASLMTCVPEIKPAADGTLWRALRDPIEWQVGEGSVVCSEMVGDRRFSASMELPGVVSCTLSDGDAGTVRYRALVQPTDPGACAIHLAVAPPGMPALKLALNRFLVALRRDLPRLGKSLAVLRVLDAFGRMVPEQVPA